MDKLAAQHIIDLHRMVIDKTNALLTAVRTLDPNIVRLFYLPAAINAGDDLLEAVSVDGPDFFRLLYPNISEEQVKINHTMQVHAVTEHTAVLNQVDLEPELLFTEFARICLESNIRDFAEVVKSFEIRISKLN